MPRTVVTGVDEFASSENGVRLECRTNRLDYPLTEDGLARTGTDAATESAFGETEDERPLGNVPFESARTVPVELTFYDPRTFRFELRANEEAGERERLIDLDEEAVRTDVDLDVEATDDRLLVTTSELRVVVGRDRWRFRVEDADGETLFEEQRNGFDAKGRHPVDPLGFTEEVTTRWPYRVSESGTSFALGPNEHVYGLGEKFTDLDKRGQTIHSWITQPNGCETEDAYKNVPFYLSTRGYGLLVDATSRVDFDFGDTSTVCGEIAVESDTFAFVFFGGPSFADVLERYTALTGRSPRPPKWTFGTWLTRYGITSRELVEELTDRIREEELPWDAIKIDPYWLRRGHSSDLVWDTDAFPDPGEMLDRLDEKGFRVALWEHPYLPAGTEAFETARDEGYLVEDGAGKPLLLDRLCESTQRGGIVDFTDPAATDWWQERHRPLLEMGVDGFWTDFGEYLPRNAVLANGRTGAQMRNVYPGLYNRAVYDVTAEVRGEENAFVWGRSAWIGGQKYPMYWSGDPRSTFESMAAVLRGGLSFAMSGFPFWSHDIGGFKGTPSPELYVRWAQFGLLSSHARFHGTTPREPWEFGEEATRIVRKFARLRYRLLPYLYSYAERAARTGLPLMRPLVLEYQDDPAAYDCQSQYLLGEELLVAPVLDPSGTVRVYLPEGEWIDHWTGERHRGGRAIDVEVPLDRTPLFVRSNSLVPMREPTQTVEEGTPDRVILRTVFDAEGAAETAFEFFDEDRDELVELVAERDADRSAYAFDTTGRTSPFEAVVSHVESEPETVAVGDVALDRVESDPEPGQWAYDPDEREVTANFPE